MADGFCINKMQTTSNEPMLIKMRTCTACETQKETSAFCEGRNQCNLCRRLASEKRCDLKSDSVGDGKKCSACGIIRPHAQFELTRNQCRSCRTARKLVTTHQKYGTDAAAAKEESASKNSGPCTACNEPFNPDTFVWRADRMCFAAKCKSCSNKCAYYKKYREKKRDENEYEYLEHNAEIARNATLRTSQKCAEENIKPPIVTLKTTGPYKLKSYHTSAKSRGLEIATDEQSSIIFKEHFTMPCYHCGVTPVMRNGELNGLDRINNNIGYVVSNVVSCCGPCNIMRGTMSMDHFKEQIRNIYIHSIMPESEISEKQITSRVVLLNSHNSKRVFDTLIESQTTVEDAVVSPEIIMANKTACRLQMELKNNTELPSKKDTEVIPSNVVLNPKRRVRNIYVPQGNQMVFYNSTTLRIGHITGSIKNAADIVGIKPSSAHNKIKNRDVIWIQPHWKVRPKVDGDEVHLSEVDNFNADVSEMNSLKITLEYFIINPQEQQIAFNDLSSMATFVGLNKRVIQEWFAKRSYKERNVSIMVDGYQLCSRVSK